MKAKVDKVDIIKLVYVPNSLNNFKTKVDDLDVGKLKTYTSRLSDATTLNHIDQFYTDKQNLEKKNWRC